MPIAKLMSSKKAPAARKHPAQKNRTHSRASQSPPPKTKMRPELRVIKNENYFDPYLTDPVTV